jgi:hypothetical protein
MYLRYLGVYDCHLRIIGYRKILKVIQKAEINVIFSPKKSSFFSNLSNSADLDEALLDRLIRLLGL